MKSIHIWIIITGILVISTVPTSFADIIRYSKEADVKDCSFVTTQVCKTIKSNPVKRCNSWHFHRAMRFYATDIVITSQRIRGFLKTSTVSAQYYNCNAQETVETDDKKVSVGTAFFVTNDCHAVTNHHVVHEASEIFLKIGSNEPVKAEIVASDPRNDIAILKGNCSSAPLSLNKIASSLKGQSVFTLGYPLIEVQGQELKASFGHINSDSGIGGDIRMFQIDVPVQPGNSGGPLLDENGHVIGIVTAKLNALYTLDRYGTIPENVNYAMKIDYLLPLLRYSDVKPKLATSHIAKSAAQTISDSEESVPLVIAK